MPRVYLTLEQDLFNRLEKDADVNGVTMNLLIQNIIERIYFGGLTYKDLTEKISLDTTVFDYTAALDELISEINQRENGEFTLNMLDSFNRLCLSTSESGYLQPSTLRARLGKLFNSAVRNDMKKNIEDRIIPGVERAKDINGELKFISRNSVYVKHI